MCLLAFASTSGYANKGCIHQAAIGTRTNAATDHENMEESSSIADLLGVLSDSDLRNSELGKQDATRRINMKLAAFRCSTGDAL